MKGLRLVFLGGFGAELDGNPLTHFDSGKTRGLLAYLAVENDRPHRRDILAGLFWPDLPDKHAQHSLSQALFSLRTLFLASPENPFFQITSQEIRLLGQHCWLDVQEFIELVQACEAHGHAAEWSCGACMVRLEQAAALYKGDFLAGFNLAGCPTFDEW